MSPRSCLTIRLNAKLIKAISKTRRLGNHSSDSDVVEAALREVVMNGFPETLRTKYILLSGYRSKDEVAEVSAFRIDEGVLSDARSLADRMKINFSQFVLHALCRFFGMELEGDE